MQGFYGMKKVEGVYQAVIPANYTGWYMHTNVEQKVSYFTEDIGLNAWYVMSIWREICKSANRKVSP